MTNFTQSVNIHGVDVYIPESIRKTKDLRLAQTKDQMNGDK